MKKYILYFNFPLSIGYVLYLYLWEGVDLTLGDAFIAFFKASVFILVLPITLVFLLYVLSVENFLVTSIVVPPLMLIFFTYSHLTDTSSSSENGLEAVKDILLVSIVASLIVLGLLKGSYFILEVFGGGSSSDETLYRGRR